MKKRDLFWISRIFSLFVIVLIFSVMFFVNMLHFNSSYIREEKNELDVFKKQIQWAVTPYLNQNDINGLKTYASDFEGDDVKFRIFTSGGKLLASSNPADTSPMVKKDSRVLKKRSQWNIYRHSIKDKKIQSIEKFKAGNSEYYIEMTLMEEAVIGKIVNAQRDLFFLFAICSFIILLAFLQLISQVRSQFNKFDNAVLKIADGELDTKLDVPKLKILEELALSVKKMTRRLKFQIERLKQLEAYKDEFIQNISHEIKTPITAINMALELFQNSDDPGQKKECFGIIQYQINSINKLVNDILMLSEITEAKTSADKNFEEINLNLLIEKTINSFDYGNIKVKFLPAGRDIKIKGNEDLIRSALENLITNAIKYSETDKIDITSAISGNFAEIGVKDYGIGIKEEYQSKIFEKFYRIDKARSRKKGGTGLGLAIVKNIAELHGGTVTLSGKENQGSTFVISLPLKTHPVI